MLFLSFETTQLLLQLIKINLVPPCYLFELSFALCFAQNLHDASISLFGVFLLLLLNHNDEALLYQNDLTNFLN